MKFHLTKALFLLLSVGACYAASTPTSKSSVPSQISSQGKGKKKPSMDQFEGKISFINSNNYSVNVIANGYSSTLYMGRSSKLTSNGKKIAFTDLKVGQKLHLTPGVSKGGVLKIAHFEVVEPTVVRNSPVPKPKTSQFNGKIESLDPFNGRMVVSTKGRWYSVELPSQIKWKGKGEQGMMSLQKGRTLTLEVEHFGVGRTEAISIETADK